MAAELMLNIVDVNDYGHCFYLLLMIYSRLVEEYFDSDILLKVKNDKIIKGLQLYQDWEILKKLKFCLSFCYWGNLPSLV
jgi:hypothetical protein